MAAMRYAGSYPPQILKFNEDLTHVLGFDLQASLFCNDCKVEGKMEGRKAPGSLNLH